MPIIIEAYITEAINYDNFKVPSRDIQKMKEYYAKGSNPKALANTVKTLDKAVSRYYISVATGWQECENSFYDRCIALGAPVNDLSKVYAQAIRDKSIDIGVSNTKQEDKPKQTVKSTQTPKPIEKPRKVVKAKVDNDDDFFPFESSVNEVSKGDLIKQNKAWYDFVIKNASKLIKDKIDLEITNTLILRWIKGKNWEGGLGNGKDIDKMYDKVCDKFNIEWEDVNSRFENLMDFWKAKIP